VPAARQASGAAGEVRRRPARLVALAFAAGFVAAVAVTLSLASPAGAPGQSEAAFDAARVNNRGVGYMNQQDFERALALFTRALALDPSLAAARLNRGVALLNLQRTDEARPILEEAAAADPGSARAWYQLALLEKTIGEAEAALAAFRRAAALAPDDPHAHYFVGLMLVQLDRHEEAMAEFRRVLALDPFFVSAEFGLARAAQRLGRSEEARAHLARFQRLVAEKLGAPITLAYGDQGELSLAEQVAPPAGAAPPAIPVRFTRVPARESGLEIPPWPEDAALTPLGAGACFFDSDNDGLPDLLVLSAARGISGALFRNLGGGRFADVTAASKLDLGGIPAACAAGDYDNDGHTDLAIAFFDKRGVRLFRNQGDGTFADATEAAGIAARHAPLGALAFADYDHDGDLDLFSGAGGELWRNNGDGTFTDGSEPTGFGERGQVASAAATDFNNDRAVDFLLTSLHAPPVILLNPREGKFAPLEAWGDDLPPNATAVAVLDFDKDGWMDVALAHRRGGPGVSLWRNVRGRRLERIAFPAPEWHWGRAVAALDFDNDGWVDIVAAGEDEVRLYRNVAGERFEDVTTAVGLDSHAFGNVVSLALADYDNDGDIDILVVESPTRLALLRNDGGNRNNWLKISLRGLADNRNGIGTKVEVFAGALRQKFEVAPAAGASQHELALHVGLGAETEADIVRLLWPTGVLQDEVGVAARGRHAVTEIDRRGSSCPVLFAWNGSRFEFITDAIGPGVVGHWVAPGVRNTPDPDEYIKVPGASLRPRDGRLHLRFVEPMEEIIYLDHVRLLAVDHPADAEVYPNERFAAAPPFPEFRVVAARGARPPAGAWDHRGRDVLPLLRERDRRYVDALVPLPFKGFVELHWVELDLGEADAAGPLRLLLHGFTDYFTATSVYAAHQAGVTALVPYVEALDAAGNWRRVVDDMGFPAGLRRTMVADLTGKLPPGARRIRIAANLKVYWDQILIDTTPPEGPGAVPYRLSEAPLAAAALGWLGFPREVRGAPAGDISYVYEEVSPSGPYARAAGAYTAFGDVRDLLARRNSRFAIFGAGEEIALEFDAAALPPLPPGWKRDYFFYADGFAKDMDFYAAYGQTVEPLPFHGMQRYPYAPGESYPEDDAALRYRLQRNTRLDSGRAAFPFRFRYPEEKR
jgi:Tfp pilus assembly protein PilF